MKRIREERFNSRKSYIDFVIRNKVLENQSTSQNKKRKETNVEMEMHHGIF